MGYETRQITVIGRISRHNSEQDRIDEDLLEELENRILMIIKEHRYTSLSLDIM